MSTAETSTSIISFDPAEGFLRITTKPIDAYTIEDAADAWKAAAEMVGFTKTPVLADSRNFTQYTKEVNDFYASKKASEGISAMAIMITSLSTRLIGNFFIKMHQPHFPTRLFTSEKEAAKWLQKFVIKK